MIHLVTQPVLAGAYAGRGRRNGGQNLERTLRTHAVEVNVDGLWLRALCRIPLHSLCDYSEAPSARPTCHVCARKWDRMREQSGDELAPTWLTHAAEKLERERAEIEAEFGVVAGLLRGVAAAMCCGDRAEASRLLSEAADLECALIGDCQATDLFDELGLTDAAETAALGGLPRKMK